jgi:predicted deacetylase
LKNFPLNWLPAGKRAAVCLSIDDLHPGTSADAYEAGGDLERGALRHILWLLERHSQLRVTLFVTADWREISPVPTRKLLARAPILRERIFLAKVLPKGAMRLDRHREFVEFLKQIPRSEIGLHGFHHVHRGLHLPLEFQKQNAARCEEILREALEIFEAASLPHMGGLQPPGWDLPDALAEALLAVGLRFVTSARDIITPIASDAVTNQSGRRGVSLIYPEFVCNDRLLHFTNNFQATSDYQRAKEIIEHGGLLAIKAHVVKNAMGHIALDGLDELYRNYLDLLFTKLEDDFGDSLCWTSMGEISARVFQN